MIKGLRTNEVEDEIYESFKSNKICIKTFTGKRMSFNFDSSNHIGDRK